jgi:hypothetical protein
MSQKTIQVIHRVIATFLIKQAGLKRTEANTERSRLSSASAQPPI